MGMMETDDVIESISREDRVFEIGEEFRSRARINSIETYREMHRESLADPEKFWAAQAEELTWFRKWDKVLDETDAPCYKWFSGGTTNLSVNCLDRHAATALKNKAAIIWEGEPGDHRVLTYGSLLREVCQFANALKKLGIKRGDRVIIYLPMVPELVVSLLACARIGAVHSVIFAGFSADSIRDRVQDCDARLVITADGGWRRGNVLGLKTIVDKALEECPGVKDVVIVKRGAGEPFPCRVHEGRDHWYHRLIADMPGRCAPEEMESEDTLFLLYTSGTTGRPKGIRHTTGGYMVYTYLTAKYVFDLRPEDVYWCTADIGWVTGHSYIVYGPLASGATCLMYEGAPNQPDEGRFWELIEKYGVTIFYTAPTAIRAFMKWGDQWPGKYDLSTLRLLGSVGEPINPEAWFWYHTVIGKTKCPIVDTWWQTETGGIMITPLPGCIPAKPGSCALPFFGVDPAILNNAGEEVKAGYLAIRKPWPGMLRGIYGDDKRYAETYWSKWPGIYFPGDGARKDDDGYFWVIGRVDDVVNVAGHRIGTAELESIFVEHPFVAEAAVVGVKHELKGQDMAAFIVLRTPHKGDAKLEKELSDLVAERIGKFARPGKITFCADVPKTRSGKIMRRLLKDIAEGRDMGNVTTLADASVIESLKKTYEED